MAASKPRALWLRLRNTPILRMLRLEEALFRADKAHSWFLTNEWDGPAEAANAALGLPPRPRLGNLGAGVGLRCVATRPIDTGEALLVDGIGL